MFDRFNRRIQWLRVSVTDRCNLSCSYCRPPETPPAQRAEDVMSYEEIWDMVRASVSLGIDRIRLTGGEPLVRRGIVDLVRGIAGIAGVQDLAMTTNGSLLTAHAYPLRQAGLKRLNISLDTVDPVRFRDITGGGELREVLAGIHAAKEAGLSRIKLNCVVDRSPEENDARGVAEFGERNGYQVQFIRRMDLEAGRFWPVVGGKGGRCERCDRLRVSSDGMVYPCLFSDVSFSIRELGMAEALRAAVGGKPASGLKSRNQFFAIGG